MKNLYIKLLTLIILVLTLSIATRTNITANNIYHSVSSDNMKIALTFDDGPHPGRTPEILDILDKYNIKATFFVIGQNISNYPDVFKEIIMSGNEIGNHTFSHRSLKECTNEYITNEIEQFNKIISNFECTIPTIIRPPGGIYNENLKEYASKNNYDIILWSVDTLDWSHKSVAEITENILTNAENGDIILMHDYISGNSPTPDVLEIVIPRLQERGFEFVTISELINETNTP